MNETRARRAIGPATQRCGEACATPKAESTKNRIQFDYTVRLRAVESAFFFNAMVLGINSIASGLGAIILPRRGEDFKMWA